MIYRFTSSAETCPIANKLFSDIASRASDSKACVSRHLITRRLTSLNPTLHLRSVHRMGYGMQLLPWYRLSWWMGVGGFLRYGFTCSAPNSATV